MRMTPAASVWLMALSFVALAWTPTASAQSAGPTWEELRAQPYPQWFQDANLGIFIHWGVSSVPAYCGEEQYSEWFLRGLQEGDTAQVRFMREHYGEAFTYRDFAPLFKAELFEPDQWADLFSRAGARYVVLVSRHHDGYALWPSRFSPGWNSMDVGPGRDLVGELTESVRETGLRMGLYYSLAEWNDLPPTVVPPTVSHFSTRRSRSGFVGRSRRTSASFGSFAEVRAPRPRSSPIPSTRRSTVSNPTVCTGTGFLPAAR